MERKQIRALGRRVKKIFIEHDEVKRIWSRFDGMRTYIKLDQFEDEDEEENDDDDKRNLFLTGLSGVGKSQIGKRYAKSVPRYTEIIDDEEIDIIPVIYVELPYPFTQAEFYKEILKALGTENFKKEPTVNELRNRVFHLLTKQRVEMIIFDEMNFIMRTKNFDNQSAMEMLKKLSNQLQLCIVCMGTPQIEKLHTMEDEYVRRFGRDRIERFEKCDEKFCELLERIEKAIESPNPIGLHDQSTGLPQLLHYYCQGRIGYLHLILKESFRLLNVYEENVQVEYSEIRLTVDIIKQAKFNLFRKNDHLITPDNVDKKEYMV
ncbi:TniB family NTP-binding protein [Paenibacillus sp. NPDC058177]|uniref:TniB family NTP-binding protein n=1 Tax=Paenibacillus sp. NPDC058177 TaxID=3346369 RepID=UPI0036DCB6D2